MTNLIIDSAGTNGQVLYSKETKNRKVPFVDKPLTAYSYLYKEKNQYEPETESLLGGLFKDASKLAKSAGKFAERAIVGNNVISETYEKIKEAEKTQAQTVTRTEEKTVYKPTTFEKTTYEPTYRTETDYKYETATKKQSLFKRISESISDISYDVRYAFKELRLGHKMKEGAKFAAIVLVKTIGWSLIYAIRTVRYTVEGATKAATVSSALVKKTVKDIKKKNEIKKIKAEETKMQNQYELQDLQSRFKEKLAQYKRLFIKEEMKPDFSQYNRYQELSNDRLKLLLNDLNSDYDRQIDIIQAKKTIAKVADGFFGGGDGEPPIKCHLTPIVPKQQKYSDKDEYIRELKRLCRSYLDNSKNVENPMLMFNEITKNFFAASSGILKEIFEMPEKKHKFKIGRFSGEVKQKWIERVPKIGIIPKGLRVYEQYSLANTIMDGFDAIFEKHVQNGIHPGMKEYGSQYETIYNFANGHRGEFDYNTDKMAAKLLKTTKGAKDNRCKVYTKIFDKFAIGGTNIKKACKNIKLKGGISMGMKSFLTMLPALT